ncbi:MAG: polysaccharide biosynthesis tyrosine autokinase [Cyanobacteria bacterium P01_G01_bin.67]
MDSNLHIEEYIDFNRYWQVLRRRWIPATVTFAGIVTLSLVAALTSEDVYQAEAQLLIKSESDRSSRIVGIPDGSPEIKRSVLDKDPIETEAKILQSRPILERVIEDLDLKSSDGKQLTYKQVIRSFNVSPIIGTDILQVNYEDPNPDVAVGFVQRAVELYSEGYSLADRAETKEASDFISKQLPKLEATVRQAEENLRLFKNRNGISNLEVQIDANIGSVSQIESQIDQVNAQLNDVNARYNRLQSQLGMGWQEASAVSSLSQSVSVQRTLKQLQNVKVQLAQKRNFLSDNAPQIISLKEEQADLTALLQQEIASTLGSQQQGLADRINILSLGNLKQAQLSEFADLGLRKEGLDQRLASLRTAYNTYQRRSNLSPQLQEQQRELERKLKAAQSTYETLLNKQNEAGIIEQRDIDKVRVIANAAIAEDTVNPDGKVIVAAGAMMGALFGMALAFLLDLKDRTIKNTQEVENLFAYPLHGVVPNLSLTDGGNQLQLPGSKVESLPQQTISMMPLKEAYQNIQVNLKLLDSDTEKKVIAITSSVPQEGKSSVSANLAVARAQCGQRILLIDADMRRPTQHRIWEIPNQVGLSNVLQGEIAWKNGVQNIMSNLDVLPSGSIPDHPIALLDSSLFQDFIEDIAQHYDQIIFDTPPIIGIADAKVIGKVIDGFLFVVRPGVADYSSATAAKKILDGTGQKVLGVIVNGADMENEPYHYNSYYYAHQE